MKYTSKCSRKCELTDRVSFVSTVLDEKDKNGIELKLLLDNSLPYIIRTWNPEEHTFFSTATMMNILFLYWKATLEHKVKELETAGVTGDKVFAECVAHCKDILGRVYGGKGFAHYAKEFAQRNCSGTYYADMHPVCPICGSPLRCETPANIVCDSALHSTKPKGRGKRWIHEFVDTDTDTYNDGEAMHICYDCGSRDSYSPVLYTNKDLLLFGTFENDNC